MDILGTGVSSEEGEGGVEEGLESGFEKDMWDAAFGEGEEVEEKECAVLI